MCADKSGTVFAPPFLICPGGLTLCQTAVIVKYIAKKFGFAPATLEDEAVGELSPLLFSSPLSHHSALLPMQALVTIRLRAHTHTHTADMITACVQDYLGEGRMQFHPGENRMSTVCHSVCVCLSVSVFVFVCVCVRAREYMCCVFTFLY